MKNMIAEIKNRLQMHIQACEELEKEARERIGVDPYAYDDSLNYKTIMCTYMTALKEVEDVEMIYGGEKNED